MRVVARLRCEVSGCDADDVAVIISSTSSDSLSVPTSCLRSIHGADFANQPNNNWLGSIRNVLRSTPVNFVHKLYEIDNKAADQDCLQPFAQAHAARKVMVRLTDGVTCPYIRVQNGFSHCFKQAFK